MTEGVKEGVKDKTSSGDASASKNIHIWGDGHPLSQDNFYYKISSGYFYESKKGDFTLSSS